MTKDQPLVSIIMPVRNGERYLRDALRSLAEQQYPHLEQNHLREDYMAKFFHPRLSAT